MAGSNEFSNLAIDTLFPVSLEIQSKNDLRNKGKLKNVCEFPMDVIRNELATFMRMTKEKAKNSEYCAYGLSWHMPSVLGHTQNHTDWENNAISQHLDENVYP